MPRFALTPSPSPKEERGAGNRFQSPSRGLVEGFRMRVNLG
ncbi:MAG: hypothetical protein RLZZ597_2565 [Cyanobacteriota bacterium]|jgi:hypothetical protein